MASPSIAGPDNSDQIASYTGLLTLADLGGYTSRQSLSGEQRMATWVSESIPDLTRKYAGLRTAGHGGDRPDAIDGIYPPIACVSDPTATRRGGSAGDNDGR